LELVCNVNIVYINLKHGEHSKLCPETSTKFYVHEFGIRNESLLIGNFTVFNPFPGQFTAANCREEAACTTAVSAAAADIA
jgi:hypothetical protein